MSKYAEIILNSDAIEIDRPFTYKVKEEMQKSISVGQLVKVPFGGGNRLSDGVVINLVDQVENQKIRYKYITSITMEKPILNKEGIKLVKFLRDNYLCKYIDGIRLVIPHGIISGITNKIKKVITFVKELEEDSKLKEGYSEILQFIKENNGVFTKTELTAKEGISTYKLNKLIALGNVEAVDKIVYRYNERDYTKYNSKELTAGQLQVIEKFNGSSNNIFLLRGVTGSGKTEVYMKLVQEAIEKGQDAIVLVPEISLTPQMIERFKGRFGREVAVFHSKLSDGERFDEWFRISEGKTKLVVGARSALFLPFNNLGLIVIDEEHEMSYKSDQNPKYHTREVAEYISKLKGCKVIMGSATPSIESYYKAISGEYHLLELNTRINNKRMPEMKLIDMREELKARNMSMFSRDLYLAMKEKLEKKEQIILFLNRRGFSTFVSCRECGYVFKCEKCDVSLTHHKEGVLVCHYCGHTQKEAKKCPKCESKYVKYFGAGTQRVEDEIKKYFPRARTLRMDVDTTRGKYSHENIYNSFKNGSADILIGTQMIAKGLDFPNVTLVGVLAADISLNIPDYRSAERTFQILTQVGGRAGRGDREGEVIIQTYTPEHYSLQYSLTHDYEGFYNEEFTIRAMMNYPPFSKVFLVNFTSKKEELIKELVAKVKEPLSIMANSENISMLGPTPCIISKIKDNYRWQIIFKGEINNDFCKKVREILYQSNKNLYNEIKISLDVNPSVMT